MVDRKERKIILCQGDKKELEEITGKEYEFCTITRNDEDDRNDKNKFTTYLTACSEGNVSDEIAYKARGIEADALIHYKEFTQHISKHLVGITNVNYVQNCAQGTPVRLKK